MRAIWNGVISFGLVNIPVGVFAAVKERPFRFHFLHNKDQGRIHNRRVCEQCQAEVSYEDLVRGYEYEKGRYVTFTERDLDRASVDSTKHFEIREFVKEGEIDPMFFDKPYYLTPGRSGEKTYSLLREVLKQTRKAGIGKLVLHHTREQLAAIRTYGSVLTLEVIRFADELRPPPSLKLTGNGSVNARELKIAEQLIQQLSGRFDPRQYEDIYEEALMKLVKDKVAGKSIRRIGEKSRKPTNVVDIMSKLKSSLKQVKAQQRKGKKSAA